MSIRKIKASNAIEEGEYIRIEQRSTRLLSMVAGALTGFFLGLVLCEISGDTSIFGANNDLAILTWSVLLSSFLGLVSGQGKEVRRVPKSDLVEIKRYSTEYSHEHVTVVLDDERMKRRFR